MPPVRRNQGVTPADQATPPDRAAATEPEGTDTAHVPEPQVPEPEAPGNPTVPAEGSEPTLRAEGRPPLADVAVERYNASMARLEQADGAAPTLPAEEKSER